VFEGVDVGPDVLVGLGVEVFVGVGLGHTHPACSVHAGARQNPL